MPDPTPDPPPDVAPPDPPAFDLGGEWQLDAEPELVPEPDPPAEPPPDPPRTSPPTREPDRPWFGRPPPPSDEPPPPPERIVEAMLFIGGPPLTAEKVCSAVRGLTSDAFREMVDGLGSKYRKQNRPYTVRVQGGGFVLALRPEYRHLKDRLYGGPREARLSQPALDVLSLVAYRQPISKPDIDALRGSDSAGPIRQLVRLGLIAVSRRAEGTPADADDPAAGRAAVGYGTTPRFLELFRLTSLDDLPRLGDPAAV